MDNITKRDYASEVFFLKDYCYEMLMLLVVLYILYLFNEY